MDDYDIDDNYDFLFMNNNFVILNKLLIKMLLNKLRFNLFSIPFIENEVKSINLIIY